LLQQPVILAFAQVLLFVSQVSVVQRSLSVQFESEVQHPEMKLSWQREPGEGHLALEQGLPLVQSMSVRQQPLINGF
jgi:hypothetical protein